MSDNYKIDIFFHSSPMATIKFSSFYTLQDMNAGMLNPIYAWLMSLTFFSFTGEMNVSH